MSNFCAGLLVLCIFAALQANCIDYSGYKVLSIYPQTEADLDLLYKLQNDYSLDLWNEPREPGIPIMTHLNPEFASNVEEVLRQRGIDYDVTFPDLQRVIENERAQHAASDLQVSTRDSASFDFGKYNEYNAIVALIKGLAAQYVEIVKLNSIGKSYENRDIYNLKISSGNSTSKPAIMMECGIHGREWTSVAACVYLVNQLITMYDSDPVIKTLVDKYEFNIIVESNPDGYLYTWNTDRLWKKTRSRSSKDLLGICLGADANRNFDIDHCGVGASHSPCNENYCGDKPFSENESRALRDLMVSLKDRNKLFVAIHAFSQLWMTPYSNTKNLPPNYPELIRIGKVGTTAIALKYGTVYRTGSIANLIYEAGRSSVDYAYVKQNVGISFQLELRDTGRYGFFLPKALILPTCEETFDGLITATQALTY